MAQRYVLFGTGDWGGWCDELFRSLGADGGHAAVVAAGQVEAGRDAVSWYRQGAEERLARVGIRTVQVPLLYRDEADGTPAIQALDGAAFVYVLGGGPRSSVAALRGSRFWHELTVRQLTYVGSSGGSMLLGTRYPTSLDYDTEPALGVFPRALIAAHWDQLDSMRPGLQQAFIDDRRGDMLVGIDVDTAMVGDGTSWEVMGRGGIHVLTDDHWTHHASSDDFGLPLLPV